MIDLKKCLKRCPVEAIESVLFYGVLLGIHELISDTDRYCIDRLFNDDWTLSPATDPLRMVLHHHPLAGQSIVTCLTNVAVTMQEALEQMYAESTGGSVLSVIIDSGLKVSTGTVEHNKLIASIAVSLKQQLPLPERPRLTNYHWREFLKQTKTIRGDLS